MGEKPAKRTSPLFELYRVALTDLRFGTDLPQLRPCRISRHGRSVERLISRCAANCFSFMISILGCFTCGDPAPWFRAAPGYDCTDGAVVSDPTEDILDKLCALADARYHDWHARILRPEQDRLLAALEKQRVSSGRALKVLRITQEFLRRAVRKRISIYKTVARQENGWGMLLKPRLDDFRNHIMRSVGATLSSRRSRTARQAAAAGYTRSALPPQQRYDDAVAEIREVVNTALVVLQAEGVVRTAGLPVGQKRSPDTTTNTQNPATVEEPAASPERQQAKLSPPWEKYEFLIDDFEIEVRVAGKSETFNFETFGCQDTRTGKPSLLWGVLLTMAGQGGVVRDEARYGKEWIAIQKKVERVRKILQARFRRTDDPIPYVHGIGYRARFLIRRMSNTPDRR